MRALSEFHQQFRAKLRAAGLDQSAFARSIGASPSKITRILTGKVALPMEEMPAWARALGLEGQEREAFLDCVSVFGSPHRVQVLVRAQREEIERLTAIAEKCKRRMAKVRLVLGPEES